MSDAIQFDLVSPERKMVSSAATMVVAPGIEGDFGAMAGHAPLLSSLRPGIVTATIDGAEQRYVVFGGIVEVGPDRCTILADEVHLFSELEPHVVDARIKDAEEALSTADHDSVSPRAQYLSDLKSLKELHVQ
jgi:F-type H+-transporting ATPase subunit epsilon